MENINRVNSYNWIKWTFCFVFFPVFAIKTISILVTNIKYKNKRTDFLYSDRYQKIFSWMNSLFFLNRNYYVVDQQKVLKSPSLFIVNSKITWDHFFIFSWLSKNEDYPIVNFFIPQNQRNKFHKFFQMLNIFSNPDFFSTLSQKKLSICFAFEEDEKIKEIIVKNYLPITVLKITKTKKNFFKNIIVIKFYDSIKRHDVLNMNEKFLVKKISNLLNTD